MNPAIDKDGNKRWYQNGKRHRIDGPAVNWSAGDKRYYINGRRLTYEELALTQFVLYKQKHEPNNR